MVQIEIILLIAMLFILILLIILIIDRKNEESRLKSVGIDTTMLIREPLFLSLIYMFRRHKKLYFEIRNEIESKNEKTVSFNGYILTKEKRGEWKKIQTDKITTTFTNQNTTTNNKTGVITLLSIGEPTDEYRLKRIIGVYLYWIYRKEHCKVLLAKIFEYDVYRDKKIELLKKFRFEVIEKTREITVLRHSA